MIETLTPEIVCQAYRLLLGREPESERAIQDGLSYGTVSKLRSAFLSSSEFRSCIEQITPAIPPGPQPVPLVSVGAPPIEVEWDTDPGTGALLLAHVQSSWLRLGYERPHWSVLSTDEFLPDRIRETSANFFASGQQDVASLLGILARAGVGSGALPHVLEFGCGIGRVTPHLARAFAKVTACDVSESHLALARQVVEAGNHANVDFILAHESDFGMTEPFDLWFSRIVLQHNPPPVIVQILRRAFRMLAPGGLAVFQVPTYALHYRFDLADYLSEMDESVDIEMHVLPQPVVFAIAAASACEPIEVLEDGSAGPPEAWRSTTFVLRKRA